MGSLRQVGVAGSTVVNVTTANEDDDDEDDRRSMQHRPAQNNLTYYDNPVIRYMDDETGSSISNSNECYNMYSMNPVNKNSSSIAETPPSNSNSDDDAAAVAHAFTDITSATSPIGAVALAEAEKQQQQFVNNRIPSLTATPMQRLPSVTTTNNTNQRKWSELPLLHKIWPITKVLLKLLLAIACLYCFICALSLMADSLRILAGRQTNSLFKNGLLRNPVVGLMIGLLVTVVLHSSATATSITIAMSAAGVLPVENAIYIVMGANIGTTVTSSCVSLIQMGDREEFQRAFAGASLGSVFNWLSVLIFLPLEVVTGFLRWISGRIVKSMQLETDKTADRAYLKKLTDPVTRSILQVNKTMMNELAESTDETLYANETILRRNATYLFSRTSLSDTQVGIITGLMSLTMLCVALVGVVKALHSLLGGKLAVMVKRVVNSNLPGPLRYFTGYLFIIFSVFAAILIQSSSVFTSTLTPLVGVGVVSLERMYTFTLGSDLGTTLTGVLAALATDANAINVAMQVAMAHLVFNALGIVLFYPIPFMRWPIYMAAWMGATTARYRWFPIFYITVLYFILPGIVIGLSLCGTIVLLIFCVPAILLFIFVMLINVLQSKRPRWLPTFLRTWEFLPEFMRSLAPYDRAMMRMNCYKKLAACSAKRNSGKKKKKSKKKKEAQIVDDEEAAAAATTTTFGAAEISQHQEPDISIICKAGKEEEAAAQQMGVSSTTLV